MSFGKFIKIFLFLVTLILSLVGVWYYHRTLYSKEVLKLEIFGPEKITAGEEFEYTVKYKNNGNFRLEDVSFVFQFPEQSLPSDEEYQKSLRVMKKLDDIYPGEEKVFHFRARLFGLKDSVHTAYATVNFRPKDLKASYQAQTSFSTVIENVPITFQFDLPDKVMAEKPFAFSLNYFSSIDYPLMDIRIKVNYPQNFQFIESHPKSIENNEWVVPVLNRAEGGRITVKGSLTGEVGEAKPFKATLGFWRENKFIALKEISRFTVLSQASIYITQLINNSPQYVAHPGDLLHYEIFFRNIGDEPLENLSLLVRLEGEPFDLDTLKVYSGSFNPGDNFIIWDKRDIDELGFLDVNQEGKVEFWVELKDEWTLTTDRGFNQIIKTKVTVGQVKEEFINKVSSKLEVDSQISFEDQVYFENSGPYPPEKGKYTTLTVVLDAKNYYNEVKNVKVRGILPSYVDLTGQIQPKDAKLVFDQESREFIWEVGDLAIGTGVLSQGPQLAFQIRVKPQDDLPLLRLIQNLKIEGEDQFVSSKIENDIGDIVLDLQNLQTENTQN